MLVLVLSIYLPATQQLATGASNIDTSNTGYGDYFGTSGSLSADGTTLVVSARLNDSDATGIGGDRSDNSTDGSGAVYLYQVIPRHSNMALLRAYLVLCL